MSLSRDWDRVFSDEVIKKTQDCGPAKGSIFRQKGGSYEIVKADNRKFDKHTVEFCTESSYTGQWDTLGMAGFGTYVFPHGVEYEGYFKDGMFHGEGTLTYPMGQKIEGEWINGTMVSFIFRFADGLAYSDAWDYCIMPDRRFYIEMCDGMRPAGREYLTNEQPTRTIPEGCYDTGKGFFDPKTKCITGALDSFSMYQKIREANNPKMVKVVGDVYEKPHVQIATELDEQWIIENCRKAGDDPVGYIPNLYERWTSGRHRDFLFEYQNEVASTSSELLRSLASDFSVEQKPLASAARDKPKEHKSIDRDDIMKIWV